MGQQIANNLTTQTGQVTGDINADQAAVDAQVQAANTAPNPTLISEAAANPSQFVTDPNSVAAFQAQENANYTGPTAFEQTPQYQTLENEVTNLQQNAPVVNTPAGIQQLVTGQETNPTTGMENLDALLLEGTPGATAPISAAETPINALPTNLANTASTEDAAIQAAEANDAAAPAGVQSAFLTGPNAVVPAWEQSLMNELNAAQAGENTYNSTINQDISELTPLEQAVNQFTGASGLTVPNPLTPYLNETPLTAAPTEANVSTPQDYATEAALQQLLGSGLGVTPINQSTAGQAGTFNVPTNPGSPNIAALTDALADSATGATWGDLSGLYGSPSTNAPVNTPYLESQALGPIQGQPNTTLSALEAFLASMAQGSNGYITPSSVYGNGYYTVGTPNGVPPPLPQPPTGGPPYLGPTGGGPSSGYGS
jgi:hypothetical protein